MATNAQLIDQALFHLGNRASYRANVLSSMKLWVDERERGRFLPWFLEKESSGLVTVEDQDYVSLPADFLRELDEGIVLVTDADGLEHKLVKAPSLDRLLSEKDEGGLPEAYYLFNGRMYLRQTPDAAYFLRFFYYGKSTVLADNDSEVTHWGAEAASALVFGSAAIFAGTVLQNMKLRDSLAAFESRALDNLLAANEARIHSGSSLLIED